LANATIEVQTNEDLSGFGAGERTDQNGDYFIGGIPLDMQLFPEERLGIIVLGNEWAYGTALRGISPRDSITQLAANMNW